MFHRFLLCRIRPSRQHVGERVQEEPRHLRKPTLGIPPQHPSHHQRSIISEVLMTGGSRNQDWRWRKPVLRTGVHSYHIWHSAPHIFHNDQEQPSHPTKGLLQSLMSRARYIYHLKERCNPKRDRRVHNQLFWFPRDQCKSWGRILRIPWSVRALLRWWVLHIWLIKCTKNKLVRIQDWREY